MAKKKDAAEAKEESKQEQAGDAGEVGEAAKAGSVDAPEAAPAKQASRAVAQVGDKVFYHREVNTGNGVKLEPTLAFLVKKAASESNLPENSFDLAILTNVYELRHGVMFSSEPKGGRWSYTKAQ